MILSINFFVSNFYECFARNKFINYDYSLKPKYIYFKDSNILYCTICQKKTKIIKINNEKLFEVCHSCSKFNEI